MGGCFKKENDPESAHLYVLISQEPEGGHAPPQIDADGNWRRLLLMILDRPPFLGGPNGIRTTSTVPDRLARSTPLPAASA